MALPPFQHFFDSHRDEVFRFLVGMVGREEADDCFQETFLAALRSYPQLRPSSNLRAWILKIARSKAVDARRARARRPAPSDEAPELPAPSAAGPRHEIWNAVLGLPDKQRAAVLLRFAADLPHRDVARVLGCSEEAARRSTHEGLKKLKEMAV